jgi:2-polyprenyl-6-methoxyphenol hydroxylase-like FAD-dependent oxidoreductase
LGETLGTVRMMLGDVRVAGLDRNHWHVWRYAEGFLGLCPLPSTEEFQLQASIAPGQEDQPSREIFQHLVDRCAGRENLRVEEPSWKSVWRANVRMVDRYRAGRVLLAGDAAHVHSPEQTSWTSKAMPTPPTATMPSSSSGQTTTSAWS